VGKVEGGKNFKKSKGRKQGEWFGRLYVYKQGGGIARKEEVGRKPRQGSDWEFKGEGNQRFK